MPNSMSSVIWPQVLEGPEEVKEVWPRATVEELGSQNCHVFAESLLCRFVYAPKITLATQEGEEPWVI